MYRQTLFPLFILALLADTASTSLTSDPFRLIAYNLRRKFSYKSGKIVAQKVTRTHCGMLCTKSDSCVGFSCVNDNDPLSNEVLCDQCYFVPHKELVDIDENYQTVDDFDTFVASTDFELNTESDIFFDGGLCDGMIIYIRGIPDTGAMKLAFFNDIDYVNPPMGPKAHVNFRIRAKYEDDTTQIAVDNLNENTQKYEGGMFYYPAYRKGNGEYTDWMIVVRETEYILFTEGRFLCRFLRDTTYALSYINTVRKTRQFTRFQWLDMRKKVKN